MYQQPSPNEYQPRTIHENNRQRLDILPAFPRVLIKTDRGRTDLDYTAPLLANVPTSFLTSHERQRRLPDAYPEAVELKFNPAVMAFFDLEEMSFIHTIFAHHLSICYARWDLDMSILDYNLVRLHKCLNQVLVMMNIEPIIIPFTPNEWLTALAFYLQIDVDLFYMKTCSFRGAASYDEIPLHSPSHDDQHIFCQDTPTSIFGMLPCNLETCPCCHPRNDLTHRQIQPAVQFSTNHIHRFLNKYQAILNCPATCDTDNIIYALTCPCGQFDFISSTTMSFAQCFIYHQQEGNRVIRESLIGTSTINRLFTKSTEQKINDTMRLYQHSTECASALQLFLDCHLEYWCLIPMKSTDALTDKKLFMSQTTIQLPINPTMKKIDMYTLINSIPKPPPGYSFSHRQIKEQFQLIVHLTEPTKPFPINVALYNMDIVAVLPDPCSEILRRLIESLFITHAECKLNETGHLIHNPNIQNYQALFNKNDTYNKLVRPASSEL